MERSRVTVQYRHLHQQVFEHEAHGVHCVVQNITGGIPERLTLMQALDAIETRLLSWSGPVDGFPRPLTDYADSYRLVVPQLVEWDLWPRVYACDHCHLVFRTDKATELRKSCVAPGCRGTHRQLPYYRVHRCGRRQQLSVPQCTNDAQHPMRFHDSGSFITAYFTCAVCNVRRDIFPGVCNCTLPNLSTQERQYRLVTARDSRAFFPHHVTVINISARLSKALMADQGPLWVLAHYLGKVDDLSGLIDEAAGRSRGTEDESAMRKLLDILEATPNLGHDDRNALEVVLRSRLGQDPGLEDARSVLSNTAIEAARQDRRLFERGFIFHERNPESLEVIADRYRTEGHHGMAARMNQGAGSARRLGFSQVAAIRTLPIALVGYGFTRQFSDHRARLTPLLPPERDRSARRPLVTIESNTEAVFFELDPRRLWSWCHINGWTNDPDPGTDLLAREWLIRQTYTPHPTDASVAIQRLTHVWAHLLIHSLEGRSAFGTNSVAEYLMERVGSFFIYVANYSSFNLGGLTTLLEQHLEDWLDAAVEQMTCVHDPVCLDERGGCHKCLALAFHCERFNRGLHRGYLVGSEHPRVRVGWALHAALPDG